MHRLSLPSLSPCIAFLLLCTTLVLVASPAYADHAMPSVIGETEAEAVRELENLDLDVRVVTVAEAPPGRVAYQEPSEGARVESGDSVLLKVGVRLKIRTTAPYVIGRSEALVLETLAQAYDLDIEYIAGPRAMEGRVLKQVPAAGESVMLRGHFAVKIVRNGVVVPVLVGRSEAQAIALLEDAGLSGHVRYVRNGGARAGVVISQDPRSGAEILPSGVVELRVSGNRPGATRPLRVRVPDLNGLPLRDAEDVLLARGLIPHVHLENRRGVAPWTVVGQETVALKLVPVRSSIGLHVAKPANMAGGIFMPSLYGMTGRDAMALLTHMGLQASVSEVPSALPPGTVFAQDIEPGVRVGAGRLTRFQVALVPPRGWRAPIVQVPDLTNARPARAHRALLRLGLLPRLERESQADWRIDRIFKQTPAAGARVRAGSDVVYYLPFRSRVPDLAGLTRTQALERLQAAGLQGLGVQRGPNVSRLTEVVWQELQAGRVIARGSLVKFQYRTVPPVGVMRKVPDVIGKTHDQARDALMAAGFKPRMRAASHGVGDTRVITQSPMAGALRPRGHEVVVTFRYVGPGRLPEYVRVPRVMGMTKAAAEGKMSALGFAVRSVRQGPDAGGATQVIAQNPLAGTQQQRGSTIILTYKVAPPAGTYVLVPNVVGQRLDKAMKKIGNAGLRHKLRRVGTHVKSQEPAAGTRVASGSQITLKLGF